MFKKFSLATLTLLSLAACNTEQQYSIAKNTAGSETPLPISILVSNLSTPESVTITSQGKIIISNIGGAPGKSNGLGYLSQNSSIVISGLDDPKGMAFLDPNLAILSDHPNVKLVNIETKEILFSLPIHQAGFLNDVVALSSNKALVSDTGTGHVYKIEKSNNNTLLYSKFIDASQLNGNGVNGLVLNERDLFLATSKFGGNLKQGHIYKAQLNDDFELFGNIERVSEGIVGNGNLDGLVYYNHKLFVSDWETDDAPASIHVFDTKTHELKYTISKNFTSPADIAFDPNKKVIYIPQFTQNKVSILDISKL